MMNYNTRASRPRVDDFTFGKCQSRRWCEKEFHASVNRRRRHITWAGSGPSCVAVAGEGDKRTVFVPDFKTDKPDCLRHESATEMTGME